MVETVLEQAPFSGHALCFGQARRFDQAPVVRWRRPLSFSKKIGERALCLAAGNERKQRRSCVRNCRCSLEGIDWRLCRDVGTIIRRITRRNFSSITGLTYGILFAMARSHIVAADPSFLNQGVLEALIAAQEKEMLAKDEAFAAQQEKLHNRDNEIEHLKLVIAKLRRMIFGTKSEKVTREIEQLELKLEELETGRAERVTAAATANTPAKTKPKRRPLPEHLPREVHTHLPAENACPGCGGEPA